MLAVAPSPNVASSSHTAISRGQTDQKSSIYLPEVWHKTVKVPLNTETPWILIESIKKTFRSHYSFASLKQAISPLQVSGSSVSFCETRAAIQIWATNL